MTSLLRIGLIIAMADNEFSNVVVKPKKAMKSFWLSAFLLYPLPAHHPRESSLSQGLQFMRKDQGGISLVNKIVFVHDKEHLLTDK